MILAVNTAARTHELALLHGGELLMEKRWEEARDDVDRLIPTLKAILEELGLSKNEITEIVVIKGPGSFTSVRTGVAFANALAEGLGAKLYGMDTFECLERKAALADPVLCVLPAGGLTVAVSRRSQNQGDEPVKIGPLAMVLKDYPHDQSLHVVYELPETLSDELRSIALEKKWLLVEGHRLQTLGEMLLTFDLEGLSPEETVEPYYLRAPHITKSSDPWKK